MSSRNPYSDNVLVGLDNLEQAKVTEIIVKKPVAQGPTTIFSDSLDSEKAPILFITARLDAIDAMASDGISTVEDTLWLVQELRKRNEEAIRVESWVMGMRQKLNDTLEKVKD